MEPNEWGCAGRTSVVVLRVMLYRVVVVAAVGRQEWCLSAACEKAVMSKAMAYMVGPDVVGACEWNGPWGRMW